MKPQGRGYRRIPVGDGATMAPLDKELMDELQFVLRYGHATRHDTIIAAEIISDYVYLVFACSQKERNRRCSIIKKATR